MYNGWKNYETWNVALWLITDELLHILAKSCKDYPDLVLRLKDMFTEQTPDGVFWADACLDMESINVVFEGVTHA